jgi:hypothetical protein
LITFSNLAITLTGTPATPGRPIVTLKILFITFSRTVATFAGLFVAFTSVFTAVTVQADQDDVPDNSTDPNIPILETILPEYVQYASWPGCTLDLLDPSCIAEVLFAGEDVILGVHEGNAIWGNVAVSIPGVFGVGNAPDFDSADIAELADDDVGLASGRGFKSAIPGALFCHCVLPKSISYPI